MRLFKLTIATALSIVLSIDYSHAQTVGKTLLRKRAPVDDESQHILETVASNLQTVKESTCLNFKDEDSCNGSVDEDGVSCVWCKCSAVPSECLSTDQAKMVPAGVFDCASPNRVTGSKASVDKRQDTVTTDGGYDGTFLQYIVKDDTVDPNLCDPSSKSISGYIDISGSQYDASGENKHLFYWFFEKRTSSMLSKEEKEEDGVMEPKDIPIILWLTGGPGCSSTMALLFENGPCSVNAEGTGTEVNPYSWTEAAHVLWLDQPAGVGYSYGDENDYDEEMISEDAFYFLQAFFKKHPEYSENPLTVIGESYGGHYAPAIAHKIWLKNKLHSDKLIPINLSGLAVGNGLTNPIVQYQYYAEMAVNNSHGIKVVSEDTYNSMTAAIPKCVSLIEECNKGDGFINRFACQTAFIVCNTAETTPYQMTGLNPYDIRNQCEHMPLCYDFTNIETWLNLESTQKALHVSEESPKWTSCNMGINLKFHTDWMKDFSPYVADLLNDGIHALIYAGDVDYICNYIGNRAWTLELDWKYKADFNAADEHEWGVGEDGSGAAGLVRTSNGFTFMQVYDAGHMVPADRPSVSVNMINHFLQGGEF